ncbi:MAG TPA: 4-alpha-glucanotransferase [Blastocatellia bacterium]|nr:4-alpha-glucanotransferase [Blastocatellia bacterium]
MRFDRSSGILLHPTSLPGRFGIGDLGPAAYQLIDFLDAGNQRLWQIMPLGPTGYGDSPYSSFSAFAGNVNLVSPERLVQDGLLAADALQETPEFAGHRVDYGTVIEYKQGLLKQAFDNFKHTQNHNVIEQFNGFRHYAEGWLDDYALFSALKDRHEGAAWNTWEPGQARRDRQALAAAREALRDQVEAHEFYQYLFFKQWLELKAYANHKAVKIIGDVPIFVAHNSADVWANREQFKLNEDGSPRVVAGVPPDYFSKTGQLWGNPIYDWQRMQADGFSWWVERVRALMRMVDIVRIDHFRGFAATWEVPAEHETAEHGEWVTAPGRELFQALRHELGDIAVIAEDLGTITPDVHALRDELRLPGMRVLQFAFGGTSDNTHLPHNYVPNTVVYTGTHDNDTTVGWFSREAGEGSTHNAEQIERERDYCRKYLSTDGREINWDFIRAAMASVADIAIIPLQDVLGLGSEARMNIPASEQGNWGWRYTEGALTGEASSRLRELAAIYGRNVE